MQLADLRGDDLPSKLLDLNNNQCVAVDGETQADFDLFARAILETSTQGKRFLFRSAASLLTSLAQLGEQPTTPKNMAEYKPTLKPGVVIVGSHVSKTTRQLKQLLEESATTGVEVDVARLRDNPQQRTNILEETLRSVAIAWKQGQTPVVYTSREELSFADIQQRLEFGIQVSSLLMDIVKGLPSEIGFLIGKGGITSNDILSTGLQLKTARLLGQIFQWRINRSYHN